MFFSLMGGAPTHPVIMFSLFLTAEIVFEHKGDALIFSIKCQLSVSLAGSLVEHATLVLGL